MKRSLKIGSLLVVVAALFITGIPIPAAMAQDYYDSYSSYDYSYESDYYYESSDCDCDDSGGGGRWRSLLAALPSVVYINGCNTTQQASQRVSY